MPLPPLLPPPPGAAAAAAGSTENKQPGKKRAIRPTTSGLAKPARKNADHPGPRYPHHLTHKSSTRISSRFYIPYESVKSLRLFFQGWTPIQTPGWVEAPNPLLSVVTTPFNFLPERSGAQSSVSASSTNTAYAPAACSATMRLRGSCPSPHILFIIYSSTSSASG